jgi:predicted acetyltransferase
MGVVARSQPELVNPIPLEDVDGWARAMASTFLSNPDGPETERRIEMMRRGWEPGRAWGVKDGARWVATLRSETRNLSIPASGGATRDLHVDALTNVTVAATHRRRGLMRQMLADSLRAAQARGDALSVLVAAEWPIYGRFGYAPALYSADYVLHRRRAGASLNGDMGRVRQVERAEFGDVAHAVFAAARRERAGQMDRSQRWWNRVLGRDGYAPSEGLPHNWVVHDGDDGPDGLLAWKAGGDFGLIPPLGHIDVWNLTTVGDAAYRDLWSYLTGIDAVDQIRLRDRPIDEPVRWLLGDARTLELSQQVDFVWVRLLDVPAALAARRYTVPGEIVLDVSDEDGDGFAAGRYRLGADGDQVECGATDAAADLEITQRALASTYLGGVRLGELRLSGGVRERTPGSLALGDLMFSTALPPWNATWF